MPLISAATIISSLALVQLTAAYFFLTSPSTISTHNLVVVLSAATGLPNASAAFSSPSALSALLAAVLAYFSMSDLAAASMHAEVSSFYWSAQAPIRLMFFFALAAASFAMRPGGLWASRYEALALGALEGAGEGLGSGVVFVWAFLEMTVWFWIYITLRDERRIAVAKAFEGQKRKEDKGF